MPRRGNHEGTRGQKPDGRFFNAVRLGGTRQYFYGKTQPAADKKARTARADYEQGMHATGADQLLGDYLQTWLDQVVRHRRPNTYANYEIAIRVHIEPFPLARLRLNQIRAAHVEAWIADRRQVVALTTLVRLRAILSAALNRAVRTELLARNPVKQADPVHVDDEEVEPLTAETARAVLAATRGTTSHALYAVALSTGLRLGELTGLRWADLDLDTRQLHVRSQMQNGRLSALKQTWHRRTIAMSRWLMLVLEAHAELLKQQRKLAGGKWAERGLVFPTEHGTPQGPANVWYAWQQVLKRLEMPPTKFHNLRHTAASLALQADVPLWKVSKMLGHRDVAVTFRVYSHLTPEGQEDIADRMENVLAGPMVVEMVVNHPISNSA